MTKALCSILIGLTATACNLTPAADLSPQQLAVSERVTLAGALNPDAAKSLARTGTLVVDLRGVDEEGRERAARAMIAAGVRYQNIPVAGASVSAQQVELLETALRHNPNRQVVVHCASGNRAALLWAAHLITQGTDAASALASVQPIINNDAITTAIANYQP